MDGVGWRGWALAFSAAILVHAGIVLFLVRQEPEPGIRPDVERVATILLGRVDSTDGDPPAVFAESIDAEMVTEVEGAAEVPPGEAAPTPPETAVSTPPAPAMHASPEEAVAFDALPTNTRPPPQHALSTPPAPATPASPEDAVALAALSIDTRPPPEAALSTPPAPATLASPTGATVLAALPTDMRPPPEAALSTPPAPATPAPPENAVALAEIEPAEPPAAEEAVAASPESTATLTPVPVPANTPTRDSVAEPVHLVGAENVDPARAAAAPEPAEIVASVETVTPSMDSQELAAEVRNIDETSDYSPLPEAAPAPPESAKVAPLENAEVLTAVEDVGLTPAEEVASTPLEPAITPSIEPASVDARASESVPEPARLVTVESIGPAHALATVEPAEIVASVELAVEIVNSQEFVTLVPEIDEATTVSPLPAAISTPPGPTTSPTLEEAEVLAATETAGSPRLEAAASSPPVPAETIGPAEEVTMRAAIDPTALKPAPGGPEAQQAQQAPDADDETGAPPDATGQDSYSAGQVEYLARLRDWLSQHLRYPSVARERHQTGTAVLRIAVDRNGSVQELELRASTGHALLDREALEVIERARPLPALPEYLGRERLEVLLNIEFVLN